jgi:hypothetical protein
MFLKGSTEGRFKMDGYGKIQPIIKSLSFPIRGKMYVALKDGRTIIVPLDKFPSIKNLSLAQRKKWYILEGEGFSFDDCDEVFHIVQVFGNYESYKYSLV